MQSFAEKYKFNVYSQNGEDGILQECLIRMNLVPDQVSCCEFGAHDGRTNSNTRRLIDLGAKGCFIEADKPLFDRLVDNMGQFSPDSIVLVEVRLSPENINQIVPQELDVLSIDVDGNDHRMWSAYSGRAKIVIVEINSSFSPRVLMTGKHGTSYRVMLKLGMQKGYFLLCHIGNMVFVQNEYKALFPELTSNPVTQADDYFDYRWINGTF